MSLSQIPLTKIMSATPAEFFRSLAHLAPNESFDQNSTRFALSRETGEAIISFKILPDRQVTGLLSLPQMEVMLEFDGLSEDARASFVHDFDLAFRRGGG
jgi:hypothetical protein